MSWTRADFIAEARRQAEKEDDLDRFPDAALKRLFGPVLRQEWRKLLDMAPRYRVLTTTVTPVLSVVSQLALCGGEIDAQVHRILSVAINGQALPENVDTGSNLTHTAPILHPRWKWENEQLVVEGVLAPVLTVRSSILPPLVPISANDEDGIDWPEEFAYVIVYELAGRYLVKGSVESKEAADQFRMADAERTMMQGALRRIGMSPEAIRPNDDASDWSLA